MVPPLDYGRNGHVLDNHDDNQAFVGGDSPWGQGDAEEAALALNVDDASYLAVEFLRNVSYPLLLHGSDLRVASSFY